MSTHQTAFKARDFEKWRERNRRLLAATLMNGGLPDRVPLETTVLNEEAHPHFNLRRIEYRSQPDRINTALISLPRELGPAPLLLALHGHEATWGEADAGAYAAGHNDDFCAYFAERGWAVLQPATMNHTLQHAGWTLQGEWTWDAMIALDYALALPEVDAGRVAVCGLSTGGHLAMNVMALDARVRAGVCGCVLSTWNHYEKRMIVPPHCDCGIRAQLQPHLEQSDWAALAAPKPFQFQHGLLDACFCPGADPAGLKPEWNRAVMPMEEFDMEFAEIRQAYELCGAADAVETHFHDGEHRVDNAAAFGWLERWIR